MNQNWYNQQEKKIENFWVFELHSTFKFVKDSILILDFGNWISDFAGI